MHEHIQLPTVRQQTNAEVHGYTRSHISILRLRDVQGRIKLSRSTIYSWIDPKSKQYKPDFPTPVSLGGGGAIGWVESEIEQWLETQISASRKAA